MVLAGAMGCDSRASSGLDSGQLRLRMKACFLLLAVDATIVSESSSIDLIGSVGLAFEGALIGNFDEEANPQGTLTRPGLFGDQGINQSAPRCLLRLALMTRVCLKVRSPLPSRAKRWSCRPLRRPCPVRR